MKILVVSLLRLGDFVQAAPVLQALKKRHPGARLDTLTFRPAADLKNLLPLVNTWWTLDRDALQAGLGRAEIPMLTSYDVLKEKLDAISNENYDLVINLTQTHFSGWVTGYVQAREKLGLTYGPNGRAHFHSPWFRYLDARAQVAAQDIFNYVDIFLQACGLKHAEPTWAFETTVRGQREVEALGLGADRPLVVIQALTSDAKKNWNGWRELIRGLDLEIVLLGSPQEQTRLEELARETRARVAILSLDGALELLTRADLLVTGDTSIKHLANASGTRVLEIALGPSDVLRTGVYKSDSLILTSTVGCAPCPHESSCSQATHACAEQLTPAAVAQAVTALLADDWTTLATQAQSHRAIKYLRTRRLGTGFWFAADLAPAQPARTVEALLERCTWKFLLNQEFQKPLVEFGSETVRLENEVRDLVPEVPPVLAHLEFLEKSEVAKNERAERALRTFTKTHKDQDLGSARRAQAKLEEDARESEIKVKLIRSLKSRLMENP